MADIFDWSTDPASNTTLDGINVNTGCPSGNIDNAIRSLMALVRNSFHGDLEAFLAGSAPLPLANGGTGSTSGVFVPAGAVFHFAMTTAPTGYLKCNGAAVSRATYADLFAAIGTTFGVGNGSTTFNLPDLRGEAIRGYDDARGVDSGRVFGSAQSDASGVDGTFYTLIPNGSNPTGDFSGSSTSTANIGGSPVSFSHINVTISGGTETRPRNIALMACIKY